MLLEFNDVSFVEVVEGVAEAAVPADTLARDAKEESLGASETRLLVREEAVQPLIRGELAIRG